MVYYLLLGLLSDLSLEALSIDPLLQHVYLVLVESLDCVNHALFLLFFLSLSFAELFFLL